MKKNITIFTVCNLAYLSKALTLAESLNKYQNESLTIIVFDEKKDIHNLPKYISILWLQDLGYEDWQSLAFMYDVIELTTSLKPYIAIKLLQESKKVIFLDPDTYIYHNLNCIIDDLNNHPVILTPHYIKPQPDHPDESDIAMMRFGSFNLGFFAVNDTTDSLKFLNWWNNRCIKLSFMESQFGLSTDQKWVTIAPCLFPYLHISHNPGLNFAPWNTFERMVTKYENNIYYINNQYPLIFFHFSNFNINDIDYRMKRASCETGLEYPLLKKLALDYAENLQRNQIAQPKTAYAFDFMSDGSYISPTLRRAYISVKDRINCKDPFDSLGKVGQFARKNYLIGTSGAALYKYPTLKDGERYILMYKIIYIVMRLILRIVGPNRFYDLSKFMVHLSIYRKHSNLWPK